MLKRLASIILTVCVTVALTLRLHAETVEDDLAAFNDAVDLLKQAQAPTSSSARYYMEKADERLKDIPEKTVIDYKGNYKHGRDAIASAMRLFDQNESRDIVNAVIQRAINNLNQAADIAKKLTAADTPQPAAPAQPTPPPAVQPPADAPSPAAVTATAPTPPAPPAAVTSPETPAPPSIKLTGEQLRAVVLVKGDNAEGTGFLVKMPDGPAVVTNIHVISNNPNIKILTNAGDQIEMLSAKGAADRDLALLYVKDAGYSYLALAAEVGKTAQPGDPIITPGNSQGGEVMLSTTGKLLGIGPERIEFDNPIYHGNSGGPVFDATSNSVLGVVTYGMKVDTSNDLDKASYSSKASAIKTSMRYFGLRLDNVPSWVPIDWKRFQIETAFLDNFEKETESLDTYLNSNGKDSLNGLAPNLWENNEKIVKANQIFLREAAGNVDNGQRVGALRQLLSDLESLGETDMDQIQNMKVFYSFNQKTAKDELDYRNAIKKELDAVDVTNVEQAIEQLDRHSSK